MGDVETKGRTDDSITDQLLTATRTQEEKLSHTKTHSICAYKTNADCPVKKCRDGEFLETKEADPDNGICCKIYMCLPIRCQPTDISNRCSNGFCSENNNNGQWIMTCMDPSPFINM